MAIFSEEWVNRIVNATPLGLVIVNYDMIIYSIDLGIEGKEFDSAIDKAKLLLKELMCSLNMDISLSRDLMSIYIYVNKLLVRAQIKKINEPLKEARHILSSLLDGFKQIKDEGKPVMSNTEQVFAGYTYGKNSLNESIIDAAGKSRGYTV